MTKSIHEVRDPIHIFVRLNSQERWVVDSRPFQRLRHIHQLALTYLVYPGATHRRFEHSLGVMELAGRVFDVITSLNNVSNDIRDLIGPIREQEQLPYWRTVLRMAALCHDLGHLPFSHAAEKELLPENWNHERITRSIIESTEMAEIWSKMRPPLNATDIVKLALGKKEAKDLEFTNWEAILSEIITGDAFGVDRIDYLLRDSHHAGVSYGKFDHFRLIDTLRILPSPRPNDEMGPGEPALGVQEGGLHSAEAMMLARYFMFSQVYFHRVRRIYDIHLKDFLKERLDGGPFPTQIEDHLRLTDNEVTAALLHAARRKDKPGHLHADRIVNRHHFKLLYERNPNDIKVNRNAGKSVFDALCAKFGEEQFRHDRFAQTGGAPDFPVELGNGEIVSSFLKSETLNMLPVVSIDNVFAERQIFEEARQWLKENRDDIVRPPEKEN